MNSNIQLIKIGSDIVRSYYQNRQFNELSKQYHHISSQNQSLLNTIQAYRKLDFVDKFHIAMTLMEEACKFRPNGVVFSLWAVYVFRFKRCGSFG